MSDKWADAQSSWIQVSDKCAEAQSCSTMDLGVGQVGGGAEFDDGLMMEGVGITHKRCIDDGARPGFDDGFIIVSKLALPSKLDKVCYVLTEVMFVETGSEEVVLFLCVRREVWIFSFH